MATQDSIVSGLFATPEQLQMAQRAQVEAQLAKEASMDPYERASYLAGMSGYGLGKLAGGIMGAPDPLLQRQAQRRALIQQVNMSDPKSLVQAIQASTSDPELASYLLGKYKELTGIQKEQSVITKNERFQQASVASERNRNLITGIEVKLAEDPSYKLTPKEEAEVRYQIQQEIKPKAIPAGPNGELMTIEPFNVSDAAPNLVRYLTGKGVTFNKGPSLSVVATPASQEAAQTQAETAKEAVATVQNAINKVDEASKLYNDSKFAGGYSQVLSGLPNSDARSLANLTSNIKSAFSVEEIAKLKAQSKTGATGFGSLAVKELETIQNAVTALDPADKKFPEQLKTIRESFDRWKKLMEQRSVRAEAKAAGQSPMAGKNPQLQPTEEAWIERAMAANKGFSRAQVISEGIKAGKLPAGYQ